MYNLLEKIEKNEKETEVGRPIKKVSKTHSSPNCCFLASPNCFLSNFFPIQLVWPDWAIFERSLGQILFQKYPKYQSTFWAILRNITLNIGKVSVVTFWAIFGNDWATFHSNIRSPCFRATIKVFVFPPNWLSQLLSPKVVLTIKGQHHLSHERTAACKKWQTDKTRCSRLCLAGKLRKILLFKVPSWWSSGRRACLLLRRLEFI